MDERPPRDAAPVAGALLIVDDNAENRVVLGRRLARRGHTITEADGGAAALALVAQQRFDLVLLDVNMPGMDGFEVLRALRRTHAAADLPVIMATARDASEDIVRALELGANDYVTKPIDFKVALARVSVHLALKIANERLAAANRRMKHDLDAAAAIQRAFLPQELPAFDGAEFAWAYRPCDELAGDTLNIIALDERRVALFVADVSGHGVPAALLSATLSHAMSPAESPSGIVRRPGAGGDSGIVPPREVALALARRFPFNLETLQYFTLVYGILDLATREFRFACAGHPGPIHLSHGTESAVVRKTGFPIGLVPIEQFESTCVEHTIQLAPGERLYLYSDGLPESADVDKKELGGAGMIEVLVRERGATLQRSVDALIEEAERWSGARGIGDDLSVVAIEVR
ncbi:MAG: PP2C family protein-serine/threonine phosphatase [bacterium]